MSPVTASKYLLLYVAAHCLFLRFLLIRFRHGGLALFVALVVGLRAGNTILLLLFINLFSQRATTSGSRLGLWETLKQTMVVDWWGYKLYDTVDIAEHLFFEVIFVICLMYAKVTHAQ